MRSSLDLHWLPLGAGGRSVRVNGRVFEALAAAREHRPRRDPYHAALTAHHDVWGRDELRAGEMWTSNSVVAWVLAGAGLAAGVALPHHGRAPGWDAGLRVAAQPGTIGAWP